LTREGQGRKGDPYKYFLPPLPHHIYSGEKPEKSRDNITSEDILENSPPINTPKAGSSAEKPGGELDLLRGSV
jgi:hypothetical protein